jgi:hypothetical protein
MTALPAEIPTEVSMSRYAGPKPCSFQNVLINARVAVALASRRLRRSILVTGYDPLIPQALEKQVHERDGPDRGEDGNEYRLNN